MKSIINLIKCHLQIVSVYEYEKNNKINLFELYEGSWDQMQRLYILATPDLPEYPIVPESSK